MFELQLHLFQSSRGVGRTSAACYRLIIVWTFDSWHLEHLEKLQKKLLELFPFFCFICTLEVTSSWYHLCSCPSLSPSDPPPAHPTGMSTNIWVCNDSIFAVRGAGVGFSWLCTILWQKFPCGYRDRYGPEGGTLVSIRSVFHAEHVFEVVWTRKPHHSEENLQY